MGLEERGLWTLIIWEGSWNQSHMCVSHTVNTPTHPLPPSLGREGLHGRCWLAGEALGCGNTQTYSLSQAAGPLCHGYPRARLSQRVSACWKHPQVLQEGGHQFGIGKWSKSEWQEKEKPDVNWVNLCLKACKNLCEYSADGTHWLAQLCSWGAGTERRKGRKSIPGFDWLPYGGKTKSNIGSFSHSSNFQNHL